MKQVKSITGGLSSELDVIKEARKIELKQYQRLPLEVKIRKTQILLQEAVSNFGLDGIYVSFSGGINSLVLLDICRILYSDIKAVFINTGLEYTCVRKFAESKDNVETIRPSMVFDKVVTQFGYPIISKEVSEAIYGTRRGWASMKSKLEKKMPNYIFLLDAPFRVSHECCHQMKKKPAIKYEREHSAIPIIATMTEESRQRYTDWLKLGCNAFDAIRPKSNPMSFWTNNDFLTYIKINALEYPNIYGDIVEKGQLQGQLTFGLSENQMEYETTGASGTGCTFCMFGIGEDLERFVRLKNQEPKKYHYIMNGGEFDDEGMWIPNKEGMGFKFVIDWLNEHGNMHIKY